MPAGWEQWGITGFLFFALISVTSALVWLAKRFLVELKEIRESTISKDMYEQMSQACNVCRQKMDKLDEGLSEVSAVQNLLAQAQSANSRTLELIMFGGKGGERDAAKG